MSNNNPAPVDGVERMIYRKHAVRWQDKSGVIHACDGNNLHGEVTLIWTVCQRDVPANTAFTSQVDEDVTCPKCIAAMSAPVSVSAGAYDVAYRIWNDHTNTAELARQHKLFDAQAAANLIEAYAERHRKQAAAPLREALASIAGAELKEPTQSDDFSWRYQAMELQRMAQMAYTMAQPVTGNALQDGAVEYVGVCPKCLKGIPVGQPCLVSLEGSEIISCMGCEHKPSPFEDQTAEIASLQARCAALEEAIKTFVDKLDRCHEHYRYVAVWTEAHRQLGPYDGPTYEAELIALKQTLAGTTGNTGGDA